LIFSEQGQGVLKQSTKEKQQSNIPAQLQAPERTKSEINKLTIILYCQFYHNRVNRILVQALISNKMMMIM
jgi:hypothetical protein